MNIGTQLNLLSMTHDEMEQWAHSAGTDFPLAVAIHVVARRHGLEPDAVWEDPKGLRGEVETMAWDLADHDDVWADVVYGREAEGETRLHWGMGSITREVG